VCIFVRKWRWFATTLKSEKEEIQGSASSINASGNEAGGEMDSKIHSILIVLAMSSLFSNSTLAGDDSARNWQLSLLFNPGEQQHKMESRGRVFIYDGLRDSEVERALDEQYDRVESMMFINTVITDENGEPMRDEVTGEMLVENDGCD
jgi:hypothetical protein